ncbi:hypothetical protein J2Z44_003786 [Clostridium punense]|uniref:Uncharacterized protein n=1 Tax=Clostridium punense TaxID=1054297 RepID=A0ABS4K9T2_9CLOT|nr:MULTISPECIES: hypothetical protein [Clostridium]EQB88773.1 hypothetical protein M918_23020 [Clostridium sp. BL8]MBP2023941.1 hypothetical protein [Clostridium punense]
MTKEEKYSYFESYNNQIHTIGRVGLILFIALLIGIPFMMATILGVVVDMKSIGEGLLKILPIYLPSSIVEFLIYVPMLGAGGGYLAFITGNLANLKIPCAATAREIANTKAGTPENEIISTLSIAISSLVTIVVIILGVMLLAPLQPILENPILIPAFNNVVPALFGALGFKYIYKSFKISILPVVIMTALYVLLPSLIKQNSLMIIPAGAIAIAVGFILYKNNKLNLK